MNRSQRRENASDLYKKLDDVRNRINLIQSSSTPDVKMVSIIRADISCLEHQLAILRLLQAEDRLFQYLWRAIFGVLGAVGGYLIIVIKNFN